MSCSSDKMILVRNASLADLSDIARMARRLAEAVADPVPTISEASLAEVLFGRARWGDCIVAVAAGTTVGYAITCRHFEAHTGKRQLRITDLFVEESARRTRVGQKMFAFILDRARRLRCNQVAWEAWKPNAPAFAFYGQLGARRVHDILSMRFDLGD